jgi:hypothetical protein
MSNVVSYDGSQALATPLFSQDPNGTDIANPHMGQLQAQLKDVVLKSVYSLL